MHKSFSYHLMELLSDYTKKRYANLYNYRILIIFVPELELNDDNDDEESIFDLWL